MLGLDQEEQYHHYTMTQLKHNLLCQVGQNLSSVGDVLLFE